MHLFLSLWIQLIQLFPALMHSNYACEVLRSIGR